MIDLKSLFQCLPPPPQQTQQYLTGVVTWVDEKVTVQFPGVQDGNMGRKEDASLEIPVEVLPDCEEGDEFIVTFKRR